MSGVLFEQPRSTAVHSLLTGQTFADAKPHSKAAYSLLAKHSGQVVHTFCLNMLTLS